MSVEELDEAFAVGLRELLVAEVEAAAPPVARRRRRVATATCVALVLAAGGGGIAYATGALTSPPGSEHDAWLARPVTVTKVGTYTIQLGAPPHGATALELRFRCLSAGQFGFGSGGAGETCDGPSPPRRASDPRAPVPPYTMPIEPGMHGLEITATPGARWTATVVYVRVGATPWSVNASGQTYGVANLNGEPDLVSVWATNHRQGYVYARQLPGPQPKSPAQAVAESGLRRTLKVYESDGKTQIGKFVIGGGRGGSAGSP